MFVPEKSWWRDRTNSRALLDHEQGHFDITERRHADVGAVGHYRIRPPVKPVTVGELAGLEGTGSGPADRPSTPISGLAKSSDPFVEHLLAIPDAGDDTDFDRDASGFRPAEL